MKSGALITAKLPAKTVARAIRETKSCQSRRKCGHCCQSRRKCSRHYQSRRRRYPLRNEPPRLSHGRKDTAPLVRHAPHRRMGWPDRAMAAGTRHSRLGVRAVSACPNIGSAPTGCRSAVPDSPSPPASREDQGCYHRRLATHLRKGSFWSYGRRRRLLRALDARFMSYPDAVHFGHPIPRKQRRSQQPPFIAGKSPSAGCGKALPAREPSVSPPFLAKNSTWEPERGPEVPSAR